MQILFTEMSLIRLGLDMIWVMANQRFNKKESIRQIFIR